MNEKEEEKRKQRNKEKGVTPRVDDEEKRRRVSLAGVQKRNEKGQLTDTVLGEFPL